ncbi:MAG: TIGR02996 domain-containing protein [Kofleriaceae bacterium]
MLAGWLADGQLVWWAPPFDSYGPRFYERLARCLIAIGDARDQERLAASVERPRGTTRTLRALQAQLAHDVIHRVRAGTLADADRAQVLAWHAAIARPRIRAHADEATLWADIARAPGDPAPRLVLADHLLERGDPRGELFGESPANEDLVREHWTAWLGDLGLVLDRRMCRWRGGMLDHIFVGRSRDQAPAWAWPAVWEHRELGAVTSVRHGAVTLERLVTLLRSLPWLRSLQADPNMIEALQASGPWAIPEITLHTGAAGLARGLAALPDTVPDVEVLTLHTPPRDMAEVCRWVPGLRVRFPRLHRVELHTQNWMWIAPTRAELAVAPVPPVIED